MPDIHKNVADKVAVSLYFGYHDEAPNIAEKVKLATVRR